MADRRPARPKHDKSDIPSDPASNDGTLPGIASMSGRKVPKHHEAANLNDPPDASEHHDIHAHTRAETD